MDRNYKLAHLKKGDPVYVISKQRQMTVVYIFENHVKCELWKQTGPNEIYFVDIDDLEILLKY